MPGEVELVAATMGISIESLFETKIGVDWYEGESEIFVLSPATTENEPGVEFPADPRGTCVFLNDKRLCSIYPVRPFECRKTIHDESTQETRERHLAIAVAWKPHKAQIQSLLKHEPESEVFSCFPFF
jgi:Fe-S-cluster containining protein